MEGKSRKKATLFRIFLIPLIAIMLIQGAIAISTLMVRRTASMLQEYSSGMMSRLVENRKVILETDMNQRWASVHEREEVMNQVLGQFLQSHNAEIDQLLGSEDMKSALLEQLLPECLNILQNSSTTGIFLVLTGGEREAARDFDGFFIRDSDPKTNPANNTDLLLERGSKHLSRTWNIPLDTNWTARFHMNGQGQNAAERYFYEPWRAGEEYPEADTGDFC